MITSVDMPLSFYLDQQDNQQRQMIELWDSNAVFDERLISYAEQCVIYLPPNDEQMPLVLYTGDNSLAERRLGTDWRKQAKGLKGCSTLPKLYQKVYDQREPLAEYVVVENGDVKCCYERLILPFRTSRGIPHLVTFCEEIEFHAPIVRQPSHDSSTHPLAQEHSHLLLGQADNPTQAPVGSG